MSQRTISIVIALMSAALIGIIAVQAYWITNAIALKNQIFDRQVSEALNTVAYKLESQQKATLINNKLGMYDPATACIKEELSLIHI